MEIKYNAQTESYTLKVNRRGLGIIRRALVAYDFGEDYSRNASTASVELMKIAQAQLIREIEDAFAAVTNR